MVLNSIIMWNKGEAEKLKPKVMIVFTTVMILLINMSAVSFNASSSSEENNYTQELNKPQAIQSTGADHALSSTGLDTNSPSASLKTESDRIGTKVPNIFSSQYFVKDIASDKAEWWDNIAHFDEDSAQLVIGVDWVQPSDHAAIDDLIAGNGGKIINTVSIEGKVISLVVDMPRTVVSTFVTQVQVNNEVRYVEPNMKFQTDLVPNDPYWSLQWGPQKIHADYAWNTTTGDPSVLVAVIDTGVDYSHGDLSSNYVALGYDWVNKDNDPMDDNGHGTHVAGIVAAVMNNKAGIAGVAQVKIMAEKGLDAGGWGTEDDLAKAIIHAVDQGADILSNSWGGPESDLIHDAIKYAYNKGTLIVAAAGNSASSTKHYPAAYDEVIAVTATDQNDNPASFTTFGDWVEVAAPGVDIYSTISKNHTLPVVYPYDYLSGTSMATPHVSGTAALIWSQFPNVTRDWVRAKLRFTADDLGEPGFDKYYGYGRINARKAVEQGPQDHDLLMFDWEKPRSVQPGEHVSLNATVMNFGINDENNVTVELLVNGNLTDSALISSLANGALATVSLAWNSLTEGTYNVTVYVVPVPNETAVQNNAVSEMVLVRYATYVLWDGVHDGDGDSLTGNYLSLYELLTSNGFIVDELTTGTINSGILKNYDILVLIDPEFDFLQSEITDIHNWVDAGGELIIIPDSGYPPTIAQIMAPYGVQLTGRNTWYGTTANIISHPITDGVSSIYYDLAWELAVSSPTEALAWSQEGYALLSVTGENVVVLSDSNIMDNYGLGMADNTQLMLNIFDWIGAKYEHELTVRLDAPAFVEPNTSTLLNATVINRGLSNETNVELFLLVNGTVVNNATIPELVNGSSYTIGYVWNPTVLGRCNVTAYAPPVTGENLTSNNMRARYISVQYPMIHPVEGQWASYKITNYDNQGRVISTGFWDLTYSHYIEPHLINVTITSRDPTGFNTSGWMTVNTMNRWVQSGVWAGLWYPGWIETNIGIGSTINLLYGPATVNGSKTVLVGIYPIDCWEVPISVYYPYLMWYDKVSGLWIGMEYTVYSYNYRTEFRLVQTNIPIGTTYEHELAVTVEAPRVLEPADSTLLNATAYNIGQNTEDNVKLSILIDGAEVKSEIIPTMPNGTSQTISYLWTPTVEVKYNVTAYAQPVAGELITINNAATQIVSVRTIKGYILFDQTHSTDSIFMYSIWVNNLTDRGYIIDTLTATPITPPSLNGYDVFVIPQAHYYYTSDEVKAIKDFVLNGGGLLVIGDDSPYIYSDLTRFAGITWEWGGYSGYTSDITPHPVTEGVHSVYFGSPSSRMLVTFPAEDIIRDTGKNILLAVSELGIGAVIGIGDEDSLYDYSIKNADNLRLANNMIDWLESRRPIPSFIYSPLDPYVGETVSFDALASYDPDGTIASYLWTFGDGGTGNGVTTTHVYAVGGTYTTTLTAIDNEGLNATFAANVTVARTTLEIQVEVGSIHFRGEIAEFYILVSSLGKPVNTGIDAMLYYNGIAYKNLSASTGQIGLGFYRVPYTIPVNASAGTYALLVEAKYLSLEGVSLKSFLVSPTLAGWNAWLIDVYGDLATIKTDVGTIQVSLSDINPRLKDIEESLPFHKARMASVDTDIGVVWVDLADINATFMSIDGRTATVDTDIGQMQVDISKIGGELFILDGTKAIVKSDLGTITTDTESIRLKVSEISGDRATIETTLGTFTGKVLSKENGIATIKTDYGTVKANVEGFEVPSTSAFAVPLDIVLLSWVIIAGLALLLAFLLRRKS